MLRRLSDGLLTCALVLLNVGCPGDLQGEWPDTPLPTCEGDIDVVREIFGRHCGSDACHDGPEPEESLDLIQDDDEAVFASLISVSSTQCDGRVRIDPNDVSQSFILDKIRGRSAIPPGCGDQMPFGSRLNPNEISCVERWIRERLDGVDGGVRPDAAIDAGDAGVEDAGEDAGPVDAPEDMGADMGPDPVDCAPIAAGGFVLCDSEADRCTGEFLASESCDALCATAGLTCVSGFENIGSGDCMFDDTMPLACDNALAHMSDYCECGRP